MDAIIVLSIGTLACFIGAWRTEDQNNRDIYLICAIVFLFIIASHAMFNPYLQLK